MAEELYTSGKLAETLRDIPWESKRAWWEHFKIKEDSVKGVCKHHGEAAAEKAESCLQVSRLCSIPWCLSAGLVRETTPGNSAGAGHGPCKHDILPEQHGVDFNVVERFRCAARPGKPEHWQLSGLES